MLSAWSNTGLAAPLKALIEDLAGGDAIVVAYVRSPVSGALSRMQQSLYDRTLLVPPVGFLHIPMLQMLKTEFGERLQVRPFERSQLVGNDIVKDFFATFLPNVRPPSAAGDGAPLNRGLSAEAMAIVQGVKLRL